MTDPTIAALADPIEPTTAMVDAGVAFALQVALHKDYGWSQYITDLWRTMDAARRRDAHHLRTQGGS